MSIVRWLPSGLEAPCWRSTLTHAPPLATDRTSTSASSLLPPLYQRKYWSNSSVTAVAPAPLTGGVIICSSCVAPVPALSESTIATGDDSGAVMVRPPGFAVVQVAAAPPPDPPFTTVHVPGMPPAK